MGKLIFVSLLMGVTIVTIELSISESSDSDSASGMTEIETKKSIAEREQREREYNALTAEIFCEDANRFNTTALLKFGRTPDIITDRGYPCDIYNVVTKSGYIIVLHRISGGKNFETTENSAGSSRTDSDSDSECRSTCAPLRNKASGSGPPVILHHGLWQSSFHFVVTETENSLAFMLADEGYDVWLFNARGSLYSNQHISMKNIESGYWNFGIDEMGCEDVHGAIDYVLNSTGYEKLYYIGYSFGSQVFFAGSSLHPSMSSKVKLMIALSPMAYMSNTKSAIMALSHFHATTLLYEAIQKLFGFSPIPDPKLADFIKTYGYVFCSNPNYTSNPCSSGLFGYEMRPEKSSQKKRMIQRVQRGVTKVVRAYPAPTSSKTIIHMSQLVNADQFQQYDYRSRNNATYGQMNTPLYKLWRVTNPVALIWSKDDLYNDPSDVSKLIRHLPNIVENYRIPSAKFSHSDFMFGEDAGELVYSKVLEFLRKYS